MPTKSKKPSIGDQSFDDFVTRVELVSMGLANISSRLDRRAYVRLRKEKQTIIHKVSTLFELDYVGGNYFDASANYKLFVGDRHATSQVLSLECTFELHFHAPAPIDKLKADKFAKRFLAAITWPYFRQLVFDTSSRMSVPPMTLPLIPEK